VSFLPENTGWGNLTGDDIITCPPISRQSLIPPDPWNIAQFFQYNQSQTSRLKKLGPMLPLDAFPLIVATVPKICRIHISKNSATDHLSANHLRSELVAKSLDIAATLAIDRLRQVSG